MTAIIGMLEVVWVTWESPLKGVKITWGLLPKYALTLHSGQTSHTVKSFTAATKNAMLILSTEHRR